jgi:site-specific DNA-methyltransferase (adenine-specific)
VSDSYTALYNPDVLSTLANLSSDEVFTPPHIVNQMLDMLPQELFKNKKTTFLDPATKSGVFLREIAKRLLVGLENEIPNLQERIDHIFHNQIFGIAITEMTSLLSRRSVYCSKYPNSKYSISLFDNPEGNIRFKKIGHVWNNTKCEICGANKLEYDRVSILENHAYEFIHSKIKEFEKMKFDVIIGNPPYQLSDGGGLGSSALPIYQKFINQCLKLKPRYLSMIIPARWYTGGRGLDEFRESMLKDKSLRIIHDFIDEKDCFPGVTIKGGVCYFLWDRDNKGDCTVISHSGSSITSKMERPLLEKDLETFIRFNEAISIYRKVRSLNEQSFSNLVSSNDPFGFDVREENSYKRVKKELELKKEKNMIAFYYNGWRKQGIAYIKRDDIKKNLHLVDKLKIFIPKAWGIGNMTEDWLNPLLSNEPSCSTETYLVVGPFENELEQLNVLSYMQTKFFHALVSMYKISQNTMKKAYSLVPLQDFKQSWTDEKLYKKYNLNKEEVNFIESNIHIKNNTDL